MHESGPGVGSGNDFVEVAHHLAAVADAEGKGVGTGKVGAEFVAGAGVEEDALGPAFTGSKDVAVTESAAGNEAAEVAQGDASAEDVGHVDVHRAEAGAGKGCGHFDLAVHALLAENGDAGTTFFVYGDGFTQRRRGAENRILTLRLCVSA